MRRYGRRSVMKVKFAYPDDEMERPLWEDIVDNKLMWTHQNTVLYFPRRLMKQTTDVI